MEFSSQEYWSGLPFLPPRDFPNVGIEPDPGIKLTQGSYPHLLHCRWILYPLSHQGSLAKNGTPVFKGFCSTMNNGLSHPWLPFFHQLRLFLVPLGLWNCPENPAMVSSHRGLRGWGFFFWGCCVGCLPFYHTSHFGNIFLTSFTFPLKPQSSFNSVNPWFSLNS